MMQVKAGFRQGQSLSRNRNWSSMTVNVVKVQTQNLSEFISSTELESEETECFHLFPLIPFMTVAYDLVRDTVM